MIYNNFEDIKLSALGMGAMRLPVLNDSDADIDEAAACKMVDYAMANGINYYDTAWGYHNGMSEIVMGKALSKHQREKFYLATKFPGYDLSNMTKVEEIFEKQLEKCGVEYFDFYLFHNVCETNIDAYLNRDYGIFDYLMKQKANGRIKHLGFSTHGSCEVMQRFLDAYGDKMEFCQIQLNYLDYTLQNAKAKVDLLNKNNIPIWVMEPLRGGKLAEIPKEHMQKLNALRPETTAPQWAFGFVQAIRGVTVILSGMSNAQQLGQNINTFGSFDPLNETEFNALLSVAASMLEKKTLPCTSCHYCVSHCPQQLDIPKIISLYNELCFSGKSFIVPRVIGAYPDDKKPSACIGCRSCEAVCPQQIKISEMMTDFTNKLKG